MEGVSPVMVMEPVLVAQAVGLTSEPLMTGMVLTVRLVVLIQPLLLV